MKEKEFARGSFRAANQRAGELLSQNGNRLLLIEALAVTLLFVAVYLLLNYACMAALTLFEHWNFAAHLTVTLFYLTLFAVTLFLVLPTVVGFCYLAERMQAGETPVLIDLFRFFESGERYVLALTVSGRLLWRLTAIVTVTEVTQALCVAFLPIGFPSVLLCAFLMSAEILLGIILLLCEFPMLHLCLRYGDDNEEMEERAMLLLEHCSVRHAARFFLGFLPQILLGLLTCGVLLIADTLPRMSIAYFEYCESALCNGSNESNFD